MRWLAENWFWILMGILFVAMHMFGHGGHGGHSGTGGGDRRRGGNEGDRDEPEGGAGTKRSGGHRH